MGWGEEVSKTVPYYISEMGDMPHQNCLKAIREWIADGAVKVTLSRRSMTRNERQNRVMHMWFADIAEQTIEPLHEVGGRCKFQYFVPVLLASETETSQRFRDIWTILEPLKTYEEKIAILGLSDIASTSLMTTKEFAQALNAMRHNECQTHYLRDPALQGLMI